MRQLRTSFANHLPSIARDTDKTILAGIQRTGARDHGASGRNRSGTPHPAAIWSTG